MDKLTDREYERIFDPIDELVTRWDITPEDAEVFLESCGYLKQ